MNESFTHIDILTNLRKIIRSINLESKRIEKQYGISIPQLLCLSFLNGQADFKASQKEIKQFLNLNASTVTGIINRLEQKGMVAKLPKTKDKRVTLITITAKGSELIKQTPEILHQQLISKLQKLSPEAITKLKTSFDTIIDFLNIKELEAAPILAAGSEISQQEQNEEKK